MTCLYICHSLTKSEYILPRSYYEQCLWLSAPFSKIKLPDRINLEFANMGAWRGASGVQTRQSLHIYLLSPTPNPTAGSGSGAGRVPHPSISWLGPWGSLVSLLGINMQLKSQDTYSKSQPHSLHFLLLLFIVL